MFKIHRWLNVNSELLLNQYETVTSVHVYKYYSFLYGFPVAQLVEHGVSNAKIMGSIPRENKTW